MSLSKTLNCIILNNLSSNWKRHNHLSSPTHKARSYILMGYFSRAFVCWFWGGGGQWRQQWDCLPFLSCWATQALNNWLGLIFNPALTWARMDRQCCPSMNVCVCVCAFLTFVSVLFVFVCDKCTQSVCLYHHHLPKQRSVYLCPQALIAREKRAVCSSLKASDVFPELNI